MTRHTRSPDVASAHSIAVMVLVSVMSAATPSIAQTCAGDCNADAVVTIDEVLTAVNIALEAAPVSICRNADADADGAVTVDELVAGINNALNGCRGFETPTATPSATNTATPTPTIPASPTVPTSADELLAWLQAGTYLGWAAESAPHPSAGPHFGTVRAFLNPIVLASLQAGNATHPAGSALVKELYGAGSQVQGWSVMVKVQGDSAGGAGWYWFERFGETTFTASIGSPVCTGCHSLGNDFVRSPFPLQ